MNRRSLFVYCLLTAIWFLVLAWQLEEHSRVRQAAQADMRNRASDIANTLGAIIRGMRFRLESRGAIPQDRLEPVLNEMVFGRTNSSVPTGELLSIVLLNLSGERVASAGKPIEPEDLSEREHWGAKTVTLVNAVALDTVVLPPPLPPIRREPPGSLSSNAPPALGTNLLAASSTNVSVAPPPPRDDRGRFRRPPAWAPRGWDEGEIERRTIHGLALTMSTEGFNEALARDSWVRAIIVLLAAISAFGSVLAWRNLTTSSDLQIRLVRASELNFHLREMNLAAAGLAHETRNPLNIIRGLAQMISKLPETSIGVREKSRDIVNEADKVAAQLNEFINYSRPREVRRSTLALGSVINEVVRALSYDLEEKKMQMDVKGEQLQIEADEQMLRQVLFNLILNAIQAANGNGQVQVIAQRQSASEAILEIRDNGPGVAPEHRTEIFKPYFTTQKTGTGLGLAVVQQIVMAHGWEIECLPNNPSGAVFRISHLKLAQKTAATEVRKA
jgi:signal transduction histidine kinase